MGIKAFLPRSLFGRSLMILVVPIVVVQLVTGFVFFDRHWGRVIGALSYALAGEVAVVAERLEADPEKTQAIGHVVVRHLDLAVTFDKGAYLPVAGQVVKADFGWERVVAESFVPALEQALGRDFVLDMRFEEKWVFLDVQLDNGVMHVSFPQRRLFSSSGYIYLLWVLGAAILLLLVAVIFMRNQIRPIRKLAAAADRFGRGRDVQFFKPEGAREVRQAGEAFMRMHENIRRQVEQRTFMLAGVSHDLRTPLTRMKLQVSMMPESTDTEHMRYDIADMERMIDGYLDFVRGDGDEDELEIDLASFLDKICEGFRRQGHVVELSGGEALRLAVRPLAMERCLANILSNAARHGDTVWVRYESGQLDMGQVAHIVIEDDGPGLDESLYEEVFKPFMRGDVSRGATEGSVGLGLPIVMDIVHAHGGQIWLERGDHGGLAVHVLLPL